MQLPRQSKTLLKFVKEVLLRMVSPFNLQAVLSTESSLTSWSKEATLLEEMALEEDPFGERSLLTKTLSLNMNHSAYPWLMQVLIQMAANFSSQQQTHPGLTENMSSLVAFLTVKVGKSSRKFKQLAVLKEGLQRKLLSANALLTYLLDQ